MLRIKTCKPAGVPAEKKATAEKDAALAITPTQLAEKVAVGCHIVFFWAGWCGPCRTQELITDELTADQVGGADIIKIDIDQSPEVTSENGINSVPTMIWFKDGEECCRTVGFTEAKQIEKESEKHFATQG